MAGIGDVISLAVPGAGEIPGWQEVIKGTQPAAGADFTRVIPGDTAERLIAVTFKLATSAVVATRAASVQFLDGDGDLLAAAPASGGVAAGAVLTPQLAVGMGFAAAAAAGDSQGGLPDMLMEPGWQVRIHVAAMDAGDQLSLVILTVQRFGSGNLRRVEVP